MDAETGTIAGEHRARRFDAADWRIVLLLIAATAVATRIVSWWNPVAHPDDQFYLFVGDRMWHGEWPYIDIWDRKPVGLFALYALIARVGGGSILAVNLIATAFVIATAMVIRRLALFFAGPVPALFSALCYVLNLPLLGGQNGQTPVFYNLFMAIAALQLFSFANDPDDRSMRRPLIAMLLCGLALTIKTVSVFEGVYFGLAFLWLRWRRGASLAKLAGLAAAMVGLAVVPFALTALPYLLRGPAAIDAFSYANFESIFVKTSWGWRARMFGAIFLGLFGTIIIVYGATGVLLRRREPSLLSKLLAGWLVAALIGFISVPNLFDHYFLPVIAPLSVSSATLYARPLGPKLFLAFAIACFVQRQVWEWRVPFETRTEFEKISSIISSALKGGCLYVAQGPSFLYETTHACRLTPYVFPHHLMIIVEQDAIGTDNLVELRRVLALLPSVIVTRKDDRRDNDPRAGVILGDALRTNYSPIYVSPSKAPASVKSVTVWERRDLAPPG